jgi:hypothetical protein
MSRGHRHQLLRGRYTLDLPLYPWMLLIVYLCVCSLVGSAGTTYSLLTTHYSSLLLNTTYSLLTTHYLLLIPYLPLTTYHLLLTTYHLLSVGAGAGDEVEAFYSSCRSGDLQVPHTIIPHTIKPHTRTY